MKIGLALGGGGVRGFAHILVVVRIYYPNARLHYFRLQFSKKIQESVYAKHMEYVSPWRIRHAKPDDTKGRRAR